MNEEIVEGMLNELLITAKLSDYKGKLHQKHGVVIKNKQGEKFQGEAVWEILVCRLFPDQEVEVIRSIRGDFPINKIIKLHTLLKKGKNGEHNCMDRKNWIRLGRAHYVCKYCKKDVSMISAFMLNLE